MISASKLQKWLLQHSHQHQNSRLIQKIPPFFSNCVVMQFMKQNSYSIMKYYVAVLFYKSCIQLLSIPCNVIRPFVQSLKVFIVFFLCIFFFKNDCSLVGECYTGTTPSVRYLMTRHHHRDNCVIKYGDWVRVLGRRWALAHQM